MVQLPLNLGRDLAVLEAQQGSGPVAHEFQGRLLNLPGLIGEMMVAGEQDPGLFQIALPYTFGTPVSDLEQARAIRARADQLWTEYQGLARSQPELGRKARDGYLRAIDSRLLSNSLVSVRILKQEGLTDAEKRAAATFFVREDRALRKLNHLNIIRRYASLVDRRLGPCVISEHVAGKSLERIWRRRLDHRQGPLPLAAAAHIAYQLVRALSHAHSQGVVHGDLRPEQVLVEDSSKEAVRNGKAKGLVKVGGFGGGKPLEPANLPYAAPETARDGTLDPAADVYQLGSTLYVLVTGRLPYESADPVDLRRQLLDPEPHPNRVHHFRGEISAKFEQLVEGAREKDPKKRWPLPKLLEAVTQLYASRAFSLNDGSRASIGEELLERAATNGALKDYYRALEALDLARDFLDGVPAEQEAQVRKSYDELAKRYEPMRASIAALKRIQREHIGPVDHLMEELYARYGKGQPLLNDEEKGVLREQGDDVVVVRRSLIDRILYHTSAAIKELAEVDAEQIGDMHRRMVDRASSQEEACSDLVKREVKFGEDYLRTTR
jgi:hypothetical protein